MFNWWETRASVFISLFLSVSSHSPRDHSQQLLSPAQPQSSVLHSYHINLSSLSAGTITTLTQWEETPVWILLNYSVTGVLATLLTHLIRCKIMGDTGHQHHSASSHPQWSRWLSRKVSGGSRLQSPVAGIQDTSPAVNPVLLRDSLLELFMNIYCQLLIFSRLENIIS